jgi:arginine exporter protein ArgO
VLAVGLWTYWEGVLEGQKYLTIQVCCTFCDIVLIALAGLKRRQIEKLKWLLTKAAVMLD